jgi:hypothetical protein
VYFYLTEDGIEVWHQTDIGLKVAIDQHKAFLKLVMEKNATSTPNPTMYSYITYFDQFDVPTSEAIGFPCRIIPQAEDISVEDALQIVNEARVPTFFIGSHRLKCMGNGRFTLSMVDWPKSARFDGVFPVPHPHRPEIVFLSADGQPRCIIDAHLTSDIGHRNTTPWRQRFVYTACKRSYDDDMECKQLRVYPTVCFYVSSDTIVDHIAYAQKCTLQRLYIIGIEKSRVHLLKQTSYI